DRALRRAVAKCLETELRLQRLAWLAGFVFERELLAPPADAALPRTRVGLGDARREQITDRLDQLLDHQTTVADDRHIGTAHLALLCRIDVDVDDLGVGRERRHLAGDA